MNKIVSAFKGLFKAIYLIIDKIIVTPISTIIYKIGRKINKDNKFDQLLNRPNVLLFVSLAFAVLLFYIVDSKATMLVVNDAEILTNQPVRVVYNSSAYVVEGIPESVDITLIGKKSELYLARQLGDNEVVIDLTDYQATDTPVKVKMTYNKPINNLDYKIDPAYATVTIKKKVSGTRTISYDLLNQDSLDPKLSVQSVELSKTEVVVRGAQDTLDSVANIKALVDLNKQDLNKAGTYNLSDLKLVAYDSQGKLIDNVEIVATNVTAKVVLDSYMKKVPIKVVTTGDLAPGRAISSITINGTEASKYEIDIYGDRSIIDKIDNVPVTIDINGQGKSGSKTSNVSISKPAGVRYITEENVSVVLNFDEAKQKTITINRILPKNVPAGSVANLASTEDQVVEVQVIGVESVINQVNAADIVAYIDLADYNAGTFSVDVKVEGNDSRVQYVVTKKVSVVITKE